MTAPPRRPSPAPAALFATPPPIESPRQRQQAEPEQQDRECVNIGPHVVLHLYADGTAGAESPLRTATWEHMNGLATNELDSLRRKVSILERWVAAKKRESVELKV